MRFASSSFEIGRRCPRRALEKVDNHLNIAGDELDGNWGL